MGDTTTSSPPGSGESGTLRLNLRMDRFSEGPAAGARHLGARLLELRVVEAPLPGSSGPPVTRTLAFGPAPLTIWAPQSPMPLFAGEFEIPTGRVLKVEAVLDEAYLVDAGGNTREIVFGAQSSDVGVLNFAPAPGTPAPELHDGALLAWEMRIPAGATGALQPIAGNRFRLNPALPGGPVEHSKPFGFSERRLLVRYAAGASSAQIDGFEAQMEAETVWVSPTGLRVVEFGQGNWHSALLRWQAFQASPLVAAVLPDPVTKVTGMDETYVDDYSYGVTGQDWMWDARVAPADDASTDYAWDYTHGSRETIIGFLDAGLDANHPDLVNNLWVNVDELPFGLVGTCGLDPDSLGLSVTEALDFDADGVFTLHDLNAELADETLRSETLELLDSCGYVVAATASSAFDPTDLSAPIVQADDFSAVFGNGVDDDANGFVDDFFGPNLRAHDARCSDGTWTAGCEDGDVNPDERCDSTGTGNCLDDVKGIEHGTHMAGLAAAEGNNGRNVAGVAMATRVLEARVDAGDNTLSVSMSLQTMEYMASKGAQIVVWEAASEQVIEAGCADAYAEVIAEKLEAYPEILFVLPAGNAALDCDDPAYLCFPSRSGAANAVSVAATDHLAADDVTASLEAGELMGMASYSNFGDQTIQLAAPGSSPYTLANAFVNWTSTTPYWYFYRDSQMETNGTSASIAIVGGVAALYLAACGDPADGAALAAAITGSARDRGSELSCAGGDCVVGGAFLDAGALVGSCAAP